MSTMTTTILLLLSVAIGAAVFSIPSASAAGTPGVDCSSTVLTMADCLPYLSNNSTLMKPEGGCCSGFKQVLKSSPDCLCQDTQQSAQLGVSLNVTKAMSLASDCHLHVPASAVNCTFSPSSMPHMSNVTGTGILSPSSTPSQNSSSTRSNATGTSTGSRMPILSPSSLSRNSGNNKRLKIILTVTIFSGTAILVVNVYVCRIIKARQAKRKNTSLDFLEGNPSLDKLEELPLFKFEKLSAATNNFQECNKLGQGGFGSVYKGTLEDGREVAIKRLSGTSRQGAEEFMNEVLVISKLQHRNLVKLLGCCGERLERMLIYEYMPNKSLDAFLFDPQKKGILDWKKRYNIIEGISRGLLYLHRDSRLKIIHRDLKAANILLDENLNPKISDFGMARIFGGTQIEADTTRVVGTYGYMPPEYAIEGRFSEKSDVFSFGVLLLEIITGKKTRWFDESSLSLLGYVWKQWIEDDDISLIDPIIAYQGFEAEISKCIHVGLLCVQEYAQDRPDISDVIAKLGATSTRTFQKPNQPGFTRFMRDTNTSTQSHQSHQKSCTNNLSITNISGR